MIKHSLLTFGLFFCIVSCWSQHISLKLVNPTEEKINFMANFMDFQDNFLLSTEDNFKTIKTENPGTVLCIDHHRRTFIYAAPNDTIDIHLSPKGLIEYSCKNNKFRKLESEFINQCFEKYGQMEGRFGKEFLSRINRPGLSKYFDPKYINEQEMLTSFYKDQLVSKEFYNYFIDVYWCLALDNELEVSPISDETISALESSYDKAEQYLKYSQYRFLLFKYNRRTMQKLGVKNELPNYLNYILTHYPNEKIKDYLLYQEMKVFLNEHHEKNSVDTNTLKLFRENCKNKLFLDEINKDLEPPTTPAFLENIINKYKGRLVLVDFWASWCMPCREEFPHEKALMKKYPNVSFVFVSVDKSNAAWQKVSKEYPDILTKDNSYLLLKSNQDEILQKINISSIPRFVLFNKNGEIIDVNAPRPSNKEIEILIEKYL